GALRGEPGRVAARTRAATGPGKRRAPMSSRGLTAASAMVRAAVGGSGCDVRTIEAAPVSCTIALMTTGTQSRSAREPRGRSSGSRSAHGPPLHGPSPNGPCDHGGPAGCIDGPGMAPCYAGACAGHVRPRERRTYSRGSRGGGSRGDVGVAASPLYLPISERWDIVLRDKREQRCSTFDTFVPISSHEPE